MDDENFKNMINYIPKEYWNDLMYMYSKDGVSFYKHCDTRNYINVDSKGDFYLYNNDSLDKVSKDIALNQLLI